MKALNIRRRPAVGRDGFTIIELLVATGVSLLLLTLLISLVSSVSDAWNKTTGNLQSENQARLILKLVGDDLQSLYARRDGRVYLAASIQGQQAGNGDADLTDTSGSIDNSADWSNGSSKPGSGSSWFLTPTSRSIRDYRFGQAGVWLRFFIRPSDRGPVTGNVADLSSVRAVSYQISRLPLGENEDDLRYVLFRAEVTNTNTLDTGLDLRAPNYNTPNATQGNPGNLRRPTRGAGYLGVNVIDFGVRFLSRDAGGREFLVFPNNGTTANPFTVANTFRTFLLTSDGTANDPYLNFPPGGNVSNTISRTWPVAAEVFVRVLSPEGADELQAIESGRIPVPAGSTFDEFWWQTAERFSRVYTRRVDLPEAAP